MGGESNEAFFNKVRAKYPILLEKLLSMTTDELLGVLLKTNSDLVAEVASRLHANRYAAGI